MCRMWFPNFVGDWDLDWRLLCWLKAGELLFWKWALSCPVELNSRVKFCLGFLHLSAQAAVWNSTKFVSYCSYCFQATLLLADTCPWLKPASTWQNTDFHEKSYSPVDVLPAIWDLCAFLGWSKSAVSKSCSYAQGHCFTLINTCVAWTSFGGIFSSDAIPEQMSISSSK